jgi:cyclopropane-fatty-acyl-phospholipid synthase
MSDGLKWATSRGSGKEERPVDWRTSATELLLFRMMVAGARLFVRSGSIELRFRDERPLLLGDGRDDAVKVCLSRLPALARIMANPGLAIGETYVDGDWEVDDAELTPLLGCLLVNEGRIEATMPVRMLNAIRDVASRVFQANTARQSRANAAHHYDIGNDLYEAFLDDEMIYSCAFFTSESQSLDAAQRHKMALTLDRAQVGPGMRVLDVGCGWGSVTRAIARRNAQAVGITLADQQLTLAGQRLPRDLHGRVSYRLEDYRRHAAENPAAYDRVVSIGMFEHVGRRHFVDYYRALNRLLKPGGRALVHSIVKPTRSPTNAWIKKYVFPGGQIPRLSEMTDSARAANLVLPHEPFVHEGSHYATTLRHWRRRFNDNFASLDRKRYDQRFHRLWNFYLAGSAAAFDALGYQVAQVVVEKPA